MMPFEVHPGLNWDMAIVFGGKAERQSQTSKVVYRNDTRRSRRFSGYHLMFQVILYYDQICDTYGFALKFVNRFDSR
jgi:hypothetical protein